MKTEIIYKGFEIRDCSGLQYIPASHCPRFEFSEIDECEAEIHTAETIEEAKELIDEILEEREWLANNPRPSNHRLR